MCYMKHIFAFLYFVVLFSQPVNAEENAPPGRAKQTSPIPSQVANTSPQEPDKQKPLSEVDEIKRDPSSLLKKFPKGGPKMAQYVAQLLVKYASLINSVLQASQQATRDQASAIGAGIARAARSLRPEIAREMTAKVGKYGNIGTQITYNAIGADINLQSRTIPGVIRIGVAGGSRPEFESLRGNVSGEVGSNRQFYLSSYVLSSSLNNYQGYDDLFRSPQMAVSVMATEAQDNGAFSTSPTR